MPVYLNEKTKKYYASFYYVDWTGKKRRKKKEGFNLAREAKAYEAEFLNKMAADCGMRFSSLCELYLEDFKTRYKITTYKNKIPSINKHFLPAFGNLPLKDITVLHIRRWQNGLISAGYKDTYLRTLNTQLSAIFNFAVKYYNLSANPVKNAGTIGKKNADDIDFWTLEEFNQFVNEIPKQYDAENAKTLVAAFMLLFYSGIREGEMLALTVADFHPQNENTKAYIDVNKNFAVVFGEEVILEPKTDRSTRKVTLPGKVADLISEHIARLPECQPSDRIFFMLGRSKLFNVHKAIAAAAGIKQIRIHDLRHSHASMLINLDVNILAISKRLGHEDIQTTLNTYGHLYPNKSEEVASKLEEFL